MAGNHKRCKKGDVKPRSTAAAAAAPKVAATAATSAAAAPGGATATAATMAAAVHNREAPKSEEGRKTQGRAKRNGWDRSLRSR